MPDISLKMSGILFRYAQLALKNLRNIKAVNWFSGKFFNYTFSAHNRRTDTISEGIPHWDCLCFII